MRAIAVTLALGWIVLGPAAASAQVLSVTTLGFLADTRPVNTALAASSELAGADATRPAIRAFARREAAGRADVLATFAAWAASAQRHAAADDAWRDPVARLLDAADSRIVIDATPKPPDLAGLAALRGPAFDDLYVATQIRGLEDLAAAYADFILNGDDQTLRALAVHDLPRVKTLLAAARRLS